MSTLQGLAAEHAPAVLAFEVANRAYFAASISDRGDDFFAEFATRHQAMLAEQEAGECAYYVLVDEDGAVLGRFNLYNIEDGAADVGYRVAQEVAGRGVATRALQALCELALRRHGLRALRAGTSEQNVASQRVLAKAGFMAVGPADPADLGGRAGIRFRRDLVPSTMSGPVAACDHAGMASERVIRDYWSALDRSNWDALAQLLAADFAATYPATGEHFDKAAFVRLNREYPGRWRAELLEVVAADETVATRSRVTDGHEAHLVASFASVAGGLITRLVEVWAEEGTTAPADRRPATAD